MAELSSTTIVPMAFYCFVLSVYFLSLAVNFILDNTSVLSCNDLVMLLPVIASAVFAVGFVIVGIGILHVNQLSWKMLFFSLAICVSSMASLIIVFLIFLMIDVKFLDPYFQTIQTTSAGWFAFLAVFLSQIIVLYYLTRDDVVAYFGGTGELLSPF